MFPMLALLLSLAAPVPQTAAEVCSRFEGFDQDRDGKVEIERIVPLGFDLEPSTRESPPVDRPDLPARRRLLVFVENRLLLKSARGAALLSPLARLQEELTRDGHEALTLAITLSPDSLPRDERFALALREVLRAFDGDGRLDGALFVGHFPDASRDPSLEGRRIAEYLDRNRAVVTRAERVAPRPSSIAFAPRHASHVGPVVGEPAGAAWARFPDIESRSTWEAAGEAAARKRTYSWSVLADWTPGLRAIDPARWKPIELANSQLFLPDDLDLTEGETVPLYIHFQGGVSAAKKNFARMERRGVLLASTLAGFSSAFRTPYEDPAAFSDLLDSVDAALSERAGRPIRSEPVVITFFSAGYGAVREFLKHPAHFDRIQGLVSADSIYASVVSDEVRAPEAAQMVDFQRFAQAAARGEKSFVLVHGMYQTPYASTAECADAILWSVAGQRVPKAWTNERGFTTASEAHVGDFHLYTFDVAEPYIHVECMQMIPELVRKHL
ncbi:hypothetical protein Poly30_20330 [Planctomycetes bacterium Poly30]|uniref:EF-hand domain-containing protein n=1 Tax=Saltatorellus ferox TaxID=2528018 RepID=A0A518ER11_9BACT|nr:hypothetical protein Poly30_20330 [Planctomycetes bacterium Poly30]